VKPLKDEMRQNGSRVQVEEFKVALILLEKI
jgi:hypothetical protein